MRGAGGRGGRRAQRGPARPGSAPPGAVRPPRGRPEPGRCGPARSERPRSAAMAPGSPAARRRAAPRLLPALLDGEPEALWISDLSKVTSQPSPRADSEVLAPAPALPASVANIARAFLLRALRLHPALPCSARPLSEQGRRAATCLLMGAGGIAVGKPCTASTRPPARPPTGLHIFAVAFALEVSVGKTNTVMALNNSNVLLPCTFTTCIGFQDLVFTWYFNSTEMIYHGKIKSKASEPFLVGRNPRVEFVGSTTGKDNNISIVLKNVEFSDAGKYTCHVKNPKEKDAQHNATIFLTVVQKMVEADNTVTLIIVGVVGGLIGLLILFMLVKRVVLFIIKKTQDGKKECLVSSSGNDNTENGLAGSKAEQKAPPKA
ncbi:LOW QUALITY PROTEIN: sodium channel subunit beta-4 [Aquila chrysaetos chrysaetos]|nr:LOW QUALITY PROTEIN: sodium channel subunit beta-4 [Aquila chrysaetos chrysaetos]